jgi:multicomponent K+:H+ antiporter subunit A
VLFIIMLSKISAPERETAMNNLWKQSRPGLIRDIVISTLVGGGVGLFALAAISVRPSVPRITEWHLQNAEKLLGFPDVVGAIVTDFRGMDTIIEISVFSVAALGVLTLLAKPVHGVRWPQRLHRPVRRKNRETLLVDGEHLIEQPHVSHFSTPLTRTITRIILPFALLLAVAQLFYGGEGPGDGFTAGVVSGLGVALWYIVFGYHDAQERLGWLKPRYLIGCGLLLVIGNAVLPMLVQMPFLHHITFDQIHLPADLQLSTTFIYETGIFLTVLGSSSTIVEAIAYPKEVEAL